MTAVPDPIPPVPPSLPQSLAQLAQLIETLRAVKTAPESGPSARSPSPQSPSPPPHLSPLMPPRLAVFLGPGAGPEPAEFIDLCYRGEPAQVRLCAASGADFRLYETPVLDSVQDEEMLKALAYGMMAIEGPYEVFAAALYHDDAKSPDSSLLSPLNTAGGDINFDTLLRTGDLAFAALCGAVMAAFLAQIPMILEGAAGLQAARIIAHYNPALWHQTIFCGDMPAWAHDIMRKNGATYQAAENAPEPYSRPPQIASGGFFAAQCLWHLSEGKQGLHSSAPGVMRAAS